jgi:hypothetical protein
MTSKRWGISGYEEEDTGKNDPLKCKMQSYDFVKSQAENGQDAAATANL